MERRLTKSDGDPLDNAMEAFSNKFPTTKKPRTDLPNIPKYLDSLGDEDLMALYGEFIAWLSYTKSDMAYAEACEERAAANCRLIEAKVLIEQWGADAKGDRVTIAKARRDTDTRVIEAQQDHLQTRTYRKLVEALFDRCERSTQLISRELSRRISDKPREGRAQRFTT